MKTTPTTIFAIAVMVFAFNASPAFAAEDSDIGKKIDNFFYPRSIGTGCVNQQTGQIMEGTTNCEQYLSNNEIDEVNDLEDVADSGEEGSTSAAGATEQ